MSSKDLRTQVNFEIIRYANCWEDASVLLKGLAPGKGSKILSIGSGGDNSFSLLTTDPELVVAVDINKIQLFLIELKKVCFVNLEYEETLSFLGFNPSNVREKQFHLLKNQLSTEARAYWEANLTPICKGIIHQGKFEKYFQMFSAKVLPWIHGHQMITELLSIKSQNQQESFYENKWNTWRWRLLFRIFFSKYVMGKYGRDPEFLKQVTGSVPQYIFNKAALHLRSESAQDNFILRYTLTGHFQDLLPHYLQKNNYRIIRENISKLCLQAGFAQNAFPSYGTFHCMNLSDIFEYMDQALFRETAALLVGGMKKNGRLAYWNLMVPRRFSEVLPERVTYCESLSKALTEIDKGFFYKEFILEKVRF